MGRGIAMLRKQLFDSRQVPVAPFVNSSLSIKEVRLNIHCAKRIPVKWYGLQHIKLMTFNVNAQQVALNRQAKTFNRLPKPHQTNLFFVGSINTSATLRYVLPVLCFR